MKKHQLFILALTLLYAVSAAAQFKPAIGFEELMISAEKDFNQVLEARKLAEMYDLPHTIYLPEGIFIEAKGVENNQVVYSIINDLIHPFNRGEVAFWEEVDARFDLSEARIHWSDKPTQMARTRRPHEHAEARGTAGSGRGVPDALVGAAYFIYAEHQRSAGDSVLARDFDLARDRALAALVNARSSLLAALVPGQGQNYWLPRAAASLEAAKSELTTLRQGTLDGSALNDLEAAAAAIDQASVARDEAKRYLADDMRTQAARVVFSDALDSLTAATERSSRPDGRHRHSVTRTAPPGRRFRASSREGSWPQ